MKESEPPAATSVNAMTVADVLERGPEAVEVFRDKAPLCLGCSLAEFCTVDYAAQVHGAAELTRALDAALGSDPDKDR